MTQITKAQAQAIKTLAGNVALRITDAPTRTTVRVDFGTPESGKWGTLYLRKQDADAVAKAQAQAKADAKAQREAAKAAKAQADAVAKAQAQAKRVVVAKAKADVWSPEVGLRHIALVAAAMGKKTLSPAQKTAVRSALYHGRVAYGDVATLVKLVG